MFGFLINTQVQSHALLCRGFGTSLPFILVGHFRLVISFVNPHQTLRLLTLVGRRGQIRLHNINTGSNWNQSTTIRYNRGYCCQTPFKKNQEGIYGHMTIHCLVCMLCKVRSHVPRPHPDFISQPRRKIGRRPGSKTTSRPKMVDSVST